VGAFRAAHSLNPGVGWAELRLFFIATSSSWLSVCRFGTPACDGRSLLVAPAVPNGAGARLIVSSFCRGAVWAVALVPGISVLVEGVRIGRSARLGRWWVWAAA